MSSPKALHATTTPYLFQRGQIFYFRTMLPVRHGCPRRVSLCISLKTTDGRTAKVIVAKLQIAMAQLLHVDLQLSNPEVVKALKRIAREHFADTLADYNTYLVGLQQTRPKQTVTLSKHS